MVHPDQRTLARAVAIAWGAVGGTLAHALEPATAPGAIRIEVTGSRVPQIDHASALPVQIIERAEILRGNWTTAGELVAHIAANFNGANGQLALGEAENPGLASANLRGLGDGNTLVLLNGRRLANYAFLSGTVDLSAIPLAAIDRVEILKDGASSIYGSDAIAGVINFITRKDFRGVEVTGQVGATQHGGGDHAQATATAGFGELGKDRVNAFVALDWQKDSAIEARGRPYASTGHRPDAGIERLGLATFPANIRTPDGGFVNPAFGTGCAPPQSLPLRNMVAAGSACGFDAVASGNLAPTAERLSAIARAAWQFAPGQDLFVEYVYARNKSELSVSPTPASRADTRDHVAAVYPADGPYYPTGFAAANGLAGPLEVYYRTAALGPRSSNVTTDAHRFVVGAQGNTPDWNYSTAFSHSVNTADESFTKGYVSASLFVPALASGRINPFGSLDREGADLLASTQVIGPARDARGTMDQVDVQLSREIATLSGGPLALAFGGEWRREKLADHPSPALATGDILGTPPEVGEQQASRTVTASFVELGVPLTPALSLTAAARYDHYSDFGGTTNPKLAVRWQPASTLLLRGSWGTGFRAPSLPDLYSPRSGSTASGFDDPVRCPVTESPADCGFGEYQVQGGGNRELQSEKSTQYTAGMIWTPAPRISLGVEWWKIDQTNVIGSLDTDEIFDHFDVYGATNVVRFPVDPANPALPGPIRKLVQWNQNLGRVDTSGFDVTLALRAPDTSLGRFQLGLDGTYVQHFTAHLDGLPPVSNAGRYGAFDAVPRWRHYAQLNWQHGPWGATLGQLFQSGYVDANSDVQGNPRRVGTYSLWDLQAVYSGLRNTSIVLGVRNLFDADPPFTNQTDTVQVGYDPAYADPRGRSFYVRLTYRFE